MKSILLFRGDVWISVMSWAIVIGISIGIFYGCDYGFGTPKNETAIVTNKYHAEAYTQMIWHSNGNHGSYFTTIYHPERWGLTMKWNNDNYDFDCSEYWCNASIVGRLQSVTIVKGYITNDFYSGQINH